MTTGPAESSRRAFMVGSAALAAALPARAGAASYTPAQMQQAVRRLRYRTDEGPVFWWLRGTYYAVIDSILTPLYGMCFGSIQHVSNRSDGGFDVRQLELGFRMEVSGRERMKQFRNPFTGETIDVRFMPIGPNRIHYSADVIPTVPSEFAGSKLLFTDFPEPAYIAGGELYAPYRASSRVVTTGKADRVVNDIAMFHGPARQALNPRLKAAPARAWFSDIASFPRWMNMGDRPGTTMLRGTGGKALTISDMPEDWLGFVREFDASILADPMAALDRPPEAYRG